MSQSIPVSKKINEKKKRNLTDFKKKQSYTGTRTVKTMTVGSNPTAWRDNLKELIRPIYGNMVYELLDSEYTEDYADAIEKPFEPADPDHLTRMEEIQFEHLLRVKSMKQEKVDENNRMNEERRSKIKGVILTTVDKELQKKCYARNADYERDLDLYNFIEFIIKEASQQTADVDVDILCAKFSSEVYWLRQSGDQSLSSLDSFFFDGDNMDLTIESFSMLMASFYQISIHLSLNQYDIW